MLTLLAAAALLAGCKRKSEEAPGARTETGERGTQARRGTDLDHSPSTQARARANYANDMQEKLSKIDTKIDELERNPDPSKQQLAARATQQRDEIRQKLDKARTITSDQWDAYKKDVDDSISSLDKELDIK
jgi:TolA-binding protein